MKHSTLPMFVKEREIDYDFELLVMPEARYSYMKHENSIKDSDESSTDSDDTAGEVLAFCSCLA